MLRRIARLVLVALAACSEDQTAILLELESPDLLVPSDIDQVRVLAVGESGVMADVTNDLPGTWPQSFAILPSSGARSELVTIKVYGLKGGAERIRRVLAPVRFVSGSTTPVSVILTRECLDVLCANPDVGCVGGMCTDGMTEDAGVDSGTEDGGVDGGVIEDGGAPDAGDEDAGDEDAEVDAGDEDAGVDAGGMCTRTGPAAILITEYVEGSSNNKAIEVTNVGGEPFSLVGCVVQFYANGNTSPTSAIELSGTLESGASVVACYRSPDGSLAPHCTVTSGSSGFNGNDAVELRCPTGAIDVVGQIGVGNSTSPPWGSGSVTTQDHTLRRKCSVSAGDPDGTDAFDPALEWDGFDVDTFDDLGSYACCP